MKRDKLSWQTIVKNFYIVAILFVTVMVFTLISPAFIRTQNIVNILRMAVPGMLIASAFTLIMISEHIDLSVGGTMSLTGVIYAILVRDGMAFPQAALITILLGIGIGWINGLLVMKLRIVHVIATLITMTLATGFARLLAPTGIGVIRGLPMGVEAFARSRFFLRLPPAFYLMLVVVAIITIIHRKTLLGKFTCAIGGNRTAAELSGVNSVRIVWILYIISAICSALAGITRTSYLSLGDPLTGDPMPMNAIIAVLMGGTRFEGGEGSVLRTMVAVLILTCLNAGMQVVGMPPYWSQLVQGLMLLFALVVSAFVKEKIID